MNHLTVNANDEEGTTALSVNECKWTKINTGLKAIENVHYGDAESFVIESTNTNIIYVGTWDGGVYKLIDGGTHWAKINAVLIGRNVLVSCNLPKNTNIVYAGTASAHSNTFVLLLLFKNLQASASASSIVLNWETSTQGSYPIAGYAIYRGIETGKEDLLKPIATVDANTTQYTDKTIELNKTYYYVVKSFDNQNPPDYSNPSNEVSATVKDTIPPTIAITSPQNNTTVATDVIQVKGTVKDNLSGVSNATLNGSSLALNSDGSFSMDVSLAKGDNTITIAATDKAGNKITKTMTITYTPPITNDYHYPSTW